MDRIDLAQDKDKWRSLNTRVNGLSGSTKFGEFLD